MVWNREVLRTSSDAQRMYWQFISNMWQARIRREPATKQELQSARAELARWSQIASEHICAALGIQAGDNVIIAHIGPLSEPVVSSLTRQIKSVVGETGQVTSFNRYRLDIFQHLLSQGIVPTSSREEVQAALESFYQPLLNALRQPPSDNGQPTAIIAVGAEHFPELLNEIYEINPFVRDLWNFYVNEFLFLYNQRGFSLRMPLPNDCVPGISFRKHMELFNQACQVDRHAIVERQAKLKKLLDMASEIQVAVSVGQYSSSMKFSTSKDGTQMTWSVNDVKQNIPFGEVYTGPIAGTMQGEVVIPWSVHVHGQLLPNVKLVIEKGRVVIDDSIVFLPTSDPSNLQVDEEKTHNLRSALQQNRNFDAIGEFGIGLNDQIDPRLAYLNVAVLEKMLGIHFALGKTIKNEASSANTDNGINAEGHCDLVLSWNQAVQYCQLHGLGPPTMRVTAIVNGQEEIVMENGKFDV